MISNLQVLLIEDDDVASEAVIRSLARVAPDISVVWAEHGQEGLDIIEGRHPDKSITGPFIVLLDLNMPVMNGFEFLEQTRMSKAFKDLVIFILTTSNQDTDRSKAYHQNVAGYMVKSAVGPQFSKLANLLNAYCSAVEPSP